MVFHQIKSSDIISAFFIILDLVLINSIAYLLPINLAEVVLFHLYISAAWIVIALITEFYIIYRYSKVTRVLRLIVRQFFFYFLILYAFIGFFKQPNMSRLALAQYVALVFVTISVLKFLNYYLLMSFREKVKADLRNVVVIGKNKKTAQLIQMFRDRVEYGFEFRKQFCPREDGFRLQECFDYILENNIDEIYCSVSELHNDEILEFVNFADNNLKTLKFLPDNKNIYTKKLTFEYYDYLPILS